MDGEIDAGRYIDRKIDEYVDRTTDGWKDIPIAVVIVGELRSSNVYPSFPVLLTLYSRLTGRKIDRVDRG